MRPFRSTRFIAVAILASTAFCLCGADLTPPNPEALSKLMKQGNWKDAYDGYRELALNAKTTDEIAADALQQASQCLKRLGRESELDDLWEKTLAAHEEHGRTLQSLARTYFDGPHHGFLIAGKFERGNHRGQAKMADSTERDRVRAIRFLLQAIKLAESSGDNEQTSLLYQSLADSLLNNRGYQEAWRLQTLTSVDLDPDIEPRDYQWGYRPYNGAPVDSEGKPVYYAVPKSWEAAKNDGERRRWALEQIVKFNPTRLAHVLEVRADFLRQQFGVQTMVNNQFMPRNEDGNDKDEGGPYTVNTLSENETLAKLATGIKRFEMPDEFNFIKLFQRVVDLRNGRDPSALSQLASIFQNRRQFAKAADYWRKWQPKESINEPLKQIIGNWGAFEPTMTHPKGEGAKIDFRYRNGNAVKFEAHAIDVDALLSDAKAYLKSDPGRVRFDRFNVAHIGYRLVQQNETKYIGKSVATWQLKLDPPENHFDARVTVSTPLQDPGAYLLTAKMEDGNTSKVIVWVSDAAIVKKSLSGKNMYYVADSVTGKPIQNATLEFFGWRTENAGQNRRRTVTTNFAERTDQNGMVTPDPRDEQKGMQFLVSARVNGKLSGYLGFSHVWHGRYYDAAFNDVRFYTITDRPVYRPGHEVKFKIWARQSQYDMGDVSKFANKSFPVTVYNPKGDKVMETTLTSDEFGGFDGKLNLSTDATLGMYRIDVRTKHNRRNHSGSVNFRVEEYKKPEFEVTVDSPKIPVALGEKVAVKINAKYFFGSPVTKATVKYKITRSEHHQDWYPIARWDWCYGRGYWWFCYDTPWYPGWQDWVGCKRPSPWWYGGQRNPPEVVAENEVEIGSDGTVEVEIDTAVAKQMHGDQDHKYSITAEVRDESRRTIVGTGHILIARKPFKVFTWLDRGHYRVGDVIGTNFSAQTLDDKPVAGEGELTLLKISYDENHKPIETAVETWSLNTNQDGTAKQQIKAQAAGQYRLSYKLKDSEQHEVEGGFLFTIIGQGFDGTGYRFNHLELIPEKQSYSPGDKVRLQINTDRRESTVMLFVRPTNGVYLPPTLLQMKGKSRIVELDVVQKDMPNFFVEAMTVADGRVYQETKEIVVPPEKRVLNVTVEPSETEFLPGEKAQVKISVTDHTGEPFVGSTVVTIYDKAIEYISGGSNIGDIKKFFWEWRRRHEPRHETNLQRYFSNQGPPNQPTMQTIGIFGHALRSDLAMGGQDKSGKKMRGMERRLGAMSAKPTSSMLSEDAMEMGAEGAELADDGADGPVEVQPDIRRNFADTALWVAALTTNSRGIANVSLKMPDNLSTWKVKVWGMGHGTRVGSGESEIVTRKNLIVRMQAPRFFMQKDQVVLSANVHNYLEEAKSVRVVLELAGSAITKSDSSPLVSSEPMTKTVDIPAGGEVRVDWRINVVDEGQAIVRMKALTDVESDAMEMSFPCYVHGMLKHESWAGTVRPDQKNAKVTIDVPEERRPEQSVLEIRYSPSLAAAMVDALPYLADYPYGCTEQTLNRFLPAAITQKTLRDMKVNLAEIRNKRTNLNAQELGDGEQRAEQWKRFDRNPVFDEDELDRMVREGLKRLTDMQNDDGGWGWFSGYGERSFPHTTSVIVHGLQVAQESGVTIVPGVLENGRAWLKRYQDAELQKIKNAPARTKPYKQHADHLDAFVYLVLVEGGDDNSEMRVQLYKDRNELAVYAKAMLALACHKQGDATKVDMLKQNIEQFLVQDTENETAYLKLPGNQSWWYWWGNEIEANAYYLKLLALTKDDSPKAARLVKYLLNNRKHSTYWKNTRDTAICVEAFAEYLRASDEFAPQMTVEIWVDGEKKQEANITADNLFTFNNQFRISGSELTSGTHDIEVRRQGKGPVYFNAYLTNFTLEDSIQEAGLEVKVERQYYKLVRVKKLIKAESSTGAAIDQAVEKFERERLPDLSQLKSGDLVEVELSIASKNDYEYLIFEDMKPAGFETVDVRSGYTGNEMGAYVEFRDNRVSFFVRQLARGKHSVSYRMRAEIPGRFAALPAHGYAMYAPELKGNSDEIKLVVED